MKLRSRIALSSLMLGAVALGLGQGTATAQPMAGEATVAADCATHTDAVNTARSAKGGNRVDPHEFSQAQVDRMEAAYRTRRGRQGTDPHGQRQAGPRPAAGKPGPTTPAFAATTVSVYWHVITNGTSGKLTTTQIQSQLNVLNNAYAASGFSFTLAGTETTTNSDWYSIAFPASGQEPSDAKAMKTALHKGTKAALNIYSTTFSDGTLGYAQFPSTKRHRPSTVSSSTTAASPGAACRRTTRATPRTHEVGHWVGLYHTFQGGCTGTATT